MYFEELGFILVSKDLLRKSFARLNEEHINKDSREEGLTAANEYLPYLFHEVNSNTIVQFLEIWFKRFQCYEHRINDGNNGKKEILKRCHIPFSRKPNFYVHIGYFPPLC